MSPTLTISSARDRLLADLSEELAAFEQVSLRRRLTSIEAINGALVRIEGRDVVCWCSNDYLGLSSHPALLKAATEAITRWGVGARASRLLAGTTELHGRLEERLASWFGVEAAIVYPSGYLANLGTLEALLSSDDLVFVDRFAHASLIDAARASRATLRVFHHNDVAHLAILLARAGGARRRLIVTEGVFSMDGDHAPLTELVSVAERYDALIYMDDAHGAFVLGDTGRGAPEAAGLAHEPFLYMGTLGKALGGQGGFVVGPRTLIEFLHNRARTFVYTTALAIPVVASALAALELLAHDPQPRHILWDRVKRLHARLDSRRSLSGTRPSHILPIVVGSAEQALALSKQLWDRGCWAPAVRPPTVPEGSARLRLSITALHSDAQIDQLAQALTDLHA